MTQDKLLDKIIKLGPWYQRVNLEGIYTTEKMLTGEHIWPHIRSLLPSNLTGMKTMDIGANACYYSLRLALEGVQVIAFEPNIRYYKQALFLKEFFEKKYEKSLNITILKRKINETDLTEDKTFDFILALSVIYFIGRQFGGKYSPRALEEQKKLIKQLTRITDKVIVRTRNKVYYSSVKYYSKLFLENNFHLLKKIKMTRPIMLYGRKSQWE